MLFSTLGLFIVLAVIGLIPAYLTRDQLETTAATVRHSFPRAFLVGLAGTFLLLPGLVVLAVGIVTIPLIPLYAAGAGLAFLGGYMAVAYAVGTLAAEQEFEWSDRFRGGPYRTLLVGLGLLLVLYALIGPFEILGLVGDLFEVALWTAASVVTWVGTTTGFGAVLLSYGGTRDDYARPESPDLGATGTGAGVA